MKYKGTAHTVGAHIDTDAIIPATYLVSTDPDELGAHCMDGLEPGWKDRLKPGDFIVAGENFGCGSSREHAPVAILGAGIPAVVAHSFARIFYRNGFNMGLALFEVGEGVEKIGDGHEIEADADKGVVRNLTTGEEIPCQPVPPFMRSILDKGGLVNYVRERLASR